MTERERESERRRGWVAKAFLSRAWVWQTHKCTRDPLGPAPAWNRQHLSFGPDVDECAARRRYCCSDIDLAVACDNKLYISTSYTTACKSPPPPNAHIIHPPTRFRSLLFKYKSAQKFLSLFCLLLPRRKASLVTWSKFLVAVMYGLEISFSLFLISSLHAEYESVDRVGRPRTVALAKCNICRYCK